jgi:Na+-translocating ferredoxin:NAD+ oxidoreductase RnfC subunit
LDSELNSRLRQRLADACVADARGNRLKLGSDATAIIGRVADSEPLFQTERVVAESHPQHVIRGLAALALVTGVRRCLLAVRADWTSATRMLRRMAAGTSVEVIAVSASCPRDVATISVDIAQSMGKTPAQAGLLRPVLFGAQVLVDVAAAVDERPLPRRTVSVAGAVRNPAILQVPLGTGISDLVAACGGSPNPGWVAFHNGVLAGERVGGDFHVDLQTHGIVILPREHPLVVASTTPLSDHLRRTASACVGCRICTDVCPVALCGGELAPHHLVQRIARGGAFANNANDTNSTLHTMTCTQCGVCTVACPSALDPARIIAAMAESLRKQGVEYLAPQTWRAVADRAGRQLSMQRLEAMLGLSAYSLAGWTGPARSVIPQRIVVALDSPAGRRRPAVHLGQAIGVGERILLSDPAAGDVDIRSQVAGRVVEIDRDESVTIRVS